MKSEELRAFGDEELLSRLDESKEELFNLRFQNATGQLDNYKRIALLKKDVARIATILSERTKGIEVSIEETEAQQRKRERHQKEKEHQAKVEAEQPPEEPEAEQPPEEPEAEQPPEEPEAEQEVEE